MKLNFTTTNPNNNNSLLRKIMTAVITVSYLLGTAGTALAKPHSPVVIDSRTLLAAIDGGKLLGVPPLPKLTAGLAATYTPEFWANWLRDITKNNKILLPIPFTALKTEIFLPHARIANGSYVSPLPTAPQPLAQVKYRWKGHTKTLANFLRDSQSDALLFMHKGKLISELYANGWSKNTAHDALSVTKSFLSTLVGIAVDEGRISSIDDSIDQYIPELRSTAWRGTTLRNMLAMRSGIYWNEHTENLAKNTAILQYIDVILDKFSGGQMGKTKNEFLKALPRVEPQGRAFNYNSANPQVLGWMLEKIYHQPFSEILSKKLWKPMGMEAPAYVVTDRTGAAFTSVSLFASSRDFARFGELMRNNGVNSDGRRIVSAQWVAQATTGLKGPAADAGDENYPGKYGFQWWSGPTSDSFQANGLMGQYVTVSPKNELTGVRLAHTFELTTSLNFAGQGNQEWHAVYRAVINYLHNHPS